MKRILVSLLIFGLLVPSCLGAERTPPPISAEAAILMDAESGRILYERDAHSKRLIASTTKLMTALVAVGSTPDLDRVMEMKPEYQAEGSSMYLKVGEKLTLKELLYGLLLASGNDAALAIAGGCAGDVETFVGWMNEWAADLGMENSHFANPNGLDHPEHYSTAYDMALLAQAVLKEETLKEMVATRSITAAGRSLTNHNKLLWQYEGCRGMKTGYTDVAGRTLVSCATRGNQTLICVTLKDRDDWKDHAALFNYGFEAWPAHLLARSGKGFRALPVTGSLIPQVEVETAAQVVYPLSAQERVRAEITLPDQVEAPVEKGDIAGKISFWVGEEEVGETYLLYAADIPADLPGPTMFQRMRDLLRGEGEVSSLAAFCLKGW